MYTVAGRWLASHSSLVVPAGAAWGNNANLFDWTSVGMYRAPGALSSSSSRTWYQCYWQKRINWEGMPSCFGFRLSSVLSPCPRSTPPAAG